MHYGRCASGECIKIKVHFGCPVVECPRATTTEYLITYISLYQDSMANTTFRFTTASKAFSSTKFKFSSKATYTRKRMFLKAHTFFHETAFRPHETNEPYCCKNGSPERFTAPFSRILIKKVCVFKNIRILVYMA